jgi:hypothetical protein
MAFTAISVVSFNHRARLWKCTGDGSSTSLTVPVTGNYLPRATDTAVSYALDTPTIFTEYPSQRGGLNSPLGGTAQAVTSTTVNSDGTLTVVFTAAPTNAHVIYGVTVHDQDNTRV